MDYRLQGILSTAEQSYIRTSLCKSLRLDSRAPSQARPFSYSIDILPLCYGSCQIITSTNKVVVGIKADVAESFSVEIDAKEDIAMLLLDGIQGECRIDDERAWKIYIDVLSDSDDVFLISTAVCTALRSARIPKLDLDTNTIKETVPIPLTSSIIFHLGCINGIVYFDVIPEETAVLDWTGAVSVRDGQIRGMRTYTGKISKNGILDVVAKAVDEEVLVQEALL